MITPAVFIRTWFGWLLPIVSRTVLIFVDHRQIQVEHVDEHDLIGQIRGLADQELDGF